MGSCMLMNSRGGPLFWGCMLMNSRGGPPHLERGSASRDNFYGSSGTYFLKLKNQIVFDPIVNTNTYELRLANGLV